MTRIPSALTGFFRRPVAATIWRLGLALLILVPWAWLGWIYFEPRPSPQGTPIAPGGGSVAEGPWGRIEINPLTIEPPMRFLDPTLIETHTKQWRFPGMTSEEVRQFLFRMGLPETAAAALVGRHATPMDPPPGITVTPPEDAVRALSPQTRYVLYEELSEIPGNEIFRYPYRYRAGSPAEWFRGAGLSPETLAMAIPLTYRRRNMMCFNDPHLVLPYIRSPIERTRFLQVLNRARTLSVRLHLRPGDDTRPLIEYWGANGREAEVGTILSPFAESEEEVRLDLIYLLPPFPRARINTFLYPQEVASDVIRDCHWATMNFYAEMPPSLKDGDAWLLDLIENHAVPATPPLRLGDVIVFLDRGGRPVHSCTHIAANIVFSKNGPTSRVPFILSDLDVLREFYQQENCELLVLRPKPAAP